MCQLTTRRHTRFAVRPVRPTASFEGWLRVLVKRLHIDWLRAESGRVRPFRSLSDLPCLDQDVFKHAFQQRFTLDEILRILEPAYPGLTLGAVEKSIERISDRLTSRHQWLLVSRNPKVVPLPNSVSTRMCPPACSTIP